MRGNRHAARRGPGGVWFAALGLCAVILSGPGSFVPVFRDERDPLLDLDTADPETGLAAEIVPGAPWIRPGPDGEFGTEDDIVFPHVTGDNDLVVRTGITNFSGAFPDPAVAGGAVPRAVAEPFAAGIPVDFVVAPVNGHAGPPPGTPIVSRSFMFSPVLVAAFADLDGDGFIGVTHLDGDVFDAAIEEAELSPVGWRIVMAGFARASGSLFVSAGGPRSAPLRVMLGAATYAGRFDPGFFNGAVRNGPAVMTRLPFLPITDPFEVMREELEIEPALVPNPFDPRIGESFTLHTDGSDLTVDGADVVSGAFARFGFGRRPAPGVYDHDHDHESGGLLRPGLDDQGAVVVYEILQRLVLADDGAASRLTLRVLPLDRLGNVADLAGPVVVTLRTGGTVRIIAPDGDGDVTTETISITDAAGATVVIDDGGGLFDDADADVLVAEGGGAIHALQVFLLDPDVDDSLLVDAQDIALIESFKGLRSGDPGFDPRLDLNSDGRIDDDDADEVASYLGTVIPTP